MQKRASKCTEQKKFLAGRRIQGRHILYDVCDGVKAVWQKGFKP
jgi:hypothetical protein